MSMIKATEAAKNWGVSVQLVRRYCRERRIPDAAMYDGIWFIPDDAILRRGRILRPLPYLLYYGDCIVSAALVTQICTIICKLTCLTAQIAWLATV